MRKRPWRVTGNIDILHANTFVSRKPEPLGNLVVFEPMALIQLDEPDGRDSFLEIRLCQPAVHRVFRPGNVHRNDNPIEDLRLTIASSIVNYRASDIAHLAPASAI